MRTMEELDDAPPETTINPQAIAEGADSQACQETAADNDTIASIGTRSKDIIFAMLAGEEDGHQLSEAIALAEAIQAERMGIIDNDQGVKLAAANGNVAGFYDGKHVHLISIDRDTYLHEKEHQRSGMPKNLDAEIISEDLLEELLNERIQEQADAMSETKRSEFGTSSSEDEDTADDDKVTETAEIDYDFSTSVRDFEERRAMSAEPGQSSKRGSYLQQHWQPTEEVKNLVGDRFESVYRALVDDKNVRPMQDAIADAVLKKADIKPDPYRETSISLHS